MRQRSQTADRIHVLAHANPATKDVARLGLRSAADMLALIRAHAGATRGPTRAPLRVTGAPALWEADEQEHRGGRRDDAARVRDIQGALDDPRTLAIVAANGGAYFSRILPELRFDSLARRRTPLWAFGFSEMTTLVNVVAKHRMGRGVYWLCPSYLAWKLKPLEAGRAAFARFWEQLPAVMAALDPRKASRSAHAAASIRFERADLATIRGTLACGRWARHSPARARLVGGCLSVLAGMAGAPLRLRPRIDGAWLVLEDVNEAPYRIDRFLAALKIAGWFERAAGVLVGDFHTVEQRDQRPAVLELLRFHLPRDGRAPVVFTRDVGHVWPMSPVLLNRPLRLSWRGRRLEFRAPG
ncbi:MAG: LD-carboxypeptidase [Phycisphaerae bacterium]